ncbi:MAG: hypothetical protein K9G33_14940 [Sneathiella sp.]|nr:hypothetical protein [Sneathiella sp.]
MPKPIIRFPSSKIGRFILGWSLIAGGIFGFLPILGFWMIPLGMLVLSADYPVMRRWRRRTQVWFGRRKRIKAKKQNNIS